MGDKTPSDIISALETTISTPSPFPMFVEQIFSN